MILTSEVREGIRDALNRPEADDLFSFPREYDRAATRAQAYFRRLVAAKFPNLIFETTTLTSLDNGASYVLTDDHLGELELWTPPGPPSGSMIVPSIPEDKRFGWYSQGKTIYFTSPKVYNPLYVRWIPATSPQIDESNNPVLPEYFREALYQRGAYELARKPGFLGDPGQYQSRVVAEWEGSPDSSNDMGILGILSRQAAYGGVEAVPYGVVPWYRGISTGP